MATWSPKATRVLEHAALRAGDEDAAHNAAAERHAKVALLRRERRVARATDFRNRWNERTRRMVMRRRDRRAR